MPDLVEKFFKEGLTDPEEQDLSQALWESEDLAEKFATLARDAYFRYGLPEPRLPHHRPPGTGGFNPWLGILGVILGIGGGLFFHRLSHGLMLPAHSSGPASGLKKMEGPGAAMERPHSPLAPTQPVGPSQTHPPGGKPALNGLSTTDLSGLSTSRVPDPSEVEQARKLSAKIEEDSAGAQANSHSSPINLDQNPSADYSSVSAIVHQSRTGPLMVRVLDTRGVEVEPLFNGSLGPGHWVFEWNGKLPNGGQAPAGFYQIEVKTGPYSQRKTVQIR